MTDHASPFSILQILFRSPPNALGLMQAEQTIVELSYDVVCRQYVVEQPLFSERAQIGPEYRECVWPELVWLVDRDKQVFYLKRLKLKVAMPSRVPELSGIVDLIRVPVDESAICRDGRP